MISPIFVLAGNSCECANGVGYCSKGGIAKCAECDAGYTLNHNKTKCIVEGDNQRLDRNVTTSKNATKGDAQPKHDRIIEKTTNVFACVNT